VGHETADFTRYRANQPDTFIPKSGAARYENGSTYRPLTVGLARSLSWIAVDLGAAAVFRSISDLTDYCLSGARDLAGAEVLTPPGAVAGIVSVRLPHVAAPDAVTHLADHGVMVRSIPENGAIRISCGFYNTRADVDQALAALRELA
jgi:selenocysteine lyase/cysteine desulfurase